MKKITLTILLFSPLVATAQMPPNMDRAKMQQMMQQMQNMQSCMQNIDQSEMKAMEQRGRALQAEMKQLCDQGNRDQAQAAAMNYAMETAKNPAVQEMKKCGEHMANVIPKMPFQDSASADGEQKNRHVCDGMQ